MRRQYAALVWAVSLVGIVALADPPTTTPSVVETTGSRVDALVQSIRDADDPSAAVAAYTNAAGRVGNNHLAVEDAYVRRMVAFNLPDLADSQAQDVVKQDPNTDVARAVVAYMQGRRGQVVEALTSIIQATAGDQPSVDPFVLRTAGQLLAWYDTRADKTLIPSDIQRDLESLRKRLSPQDDFTAAYADARDAYEGKSASGTPAPQAPAIVPSYDSAGGAAAPEQPSADTASMADYTPSYVPSSAYDSNYSWTRFATPNSYYAPYYFNNPYPSWYFPAYNPPPVIIVPGGNHHDHNDNDHHHNNHHGWDNHPGPGTPPPSRGDGDTPRRHRFDDLRDRPNKDPARPAPRPIEPKTQMPIPPARVQPPESRGKVSPDTPPKQPPTPRPSAPAPKAQPRPDPPAAKPTPAPRPDPGGAGQSRSGGVGGRSNDSGTGGRSKP